MTLSYEAEELKVSGMYDVMLGSARELSWRQEGKGGSQLYPSNTKQASGGCLSGFLLKKRHVSRGWVLPQRKEVRGSRQVVFSVKGICLYRICQGAKKPPMYFYKRMGKGFANDVLQEKEINNRNIFMLFSPFLSENAIIALPSQKKKGQKLFWESPRKAPATWNNVPTTSPVQNSISCAL